jgi:hypothetical protein
MINSENETYGCKNKAFEVCEIFKYLVWRMHKNYSSLFMCVQVSFSLT